jgi:hypothetical protein
MIFKKIIILIFVIISSFSEVSRSPEDTAIINQFSSSSLMVTETVKEEEVTFEQTKNNSKVIAEEIKQEKMPITQSENDSAIKTEQANREDDLVKQNEKKSKRRKKKKKIKRRSSKELLRSYNEARAKLEKEEREELRRLTLGYYDKVTYKPTVLLSKNYWMYKLFPNKVYKMAEKSENPEQYMEDFHKSFQTIEKATKDEIEAEEKRLRKKELRKRIKMRDIIYDVKFGFHRNISDIKPETLRNVEELHYRRSAFKEYYRFSWSNVIKYGPTLKEVENLLFIIAFVRFCIYAIRYDIKTAFIICSIGLISSFIYVMLLTDFVVLPFERMYLCPSFFRFLFEESLYRDKISDSMFLDNVYVAPRPGWKSILKTGFFKMKCWWADEIIDGRLLTADNWFAHLVVKLDSKINELTLPSFITEAIEYIQKVVIPYCNRVYQGYKYNLTGLIVYYLVLRLGKEVVPYHIQWNVMFYCLYMNFGSYIWDWFRNSQELLQLTFIPQMRYVDINYMNLFHSTYIGVSVYLIMLAMLHAVFSQYFYIPLWVPNMEAHIGQRPKDDIYSGGYTSWQDEIRFWEPGPADLKLWFGVLGKGPNDRKKKRKRRKKKKKPD